MQELEIWRSAEAGVEIGDTIRVQIGKGYLRGIVTSLDADGDPHARVTEDTADTHATTFNLPRCKCEVLVPAPISIRPEAIRDAEREQNQMMVNLRLNQDLEYRIRLARSQGRPLDAFALECERGNYR